MLNSWGLSHESTLFRNWRAWTIENCKSETDSTKNDGRGKRERERKRKLLSFKAEINCKAEEKECSAVCSKCR
jgi:hypothetical protein